MSDAQPDILERLTKVAVALNKASLYESKQVVQEAFTEIVRLRHQVRDAEKTVQHLKTNIETQRHQTPAPSPALAASTSAPQPPLVSESRSFDDEDWDESLDDDDEQEEAEVTPQLPQYFAIKIGERYLQAFTYAEWDVHLHRVGSDGFPGVWNEAAARQMAACFTALGAKAEAVDCSVLAPNGLRRA